MNGEWMRCGNLSVVPFPETTDPAEPRRADLEPTPTAQSVAGWFGFLTVIAYMAAAVGVVAIFANWERDALAASVWFAIGMTGSALSLHAIAALLNIVSVIAADLRALRLGQ